MLCLSDFKNQPKLHIALNQLANFCMQYMLQHVVYASVSVFFFTSGPPLSLSQFIHTHNYREFPR